MKTKEIKTDAFRTWLGGDGIVRTIGMPGAVFTLEVAKDNLDSIKKMIPEGKRRLLLIYAQGMKSISLEARRYFESTAGEVLDAIAILGGRTMNVGAMIAEIFMGFSKPNCPIKIFSSEQKAIEWLKRQN